MITASARWRATEYLTQSKIFATKEGAQLMPETIETLCANE